MGPFGALAAILHALLVLRAGYGDALLAYALGALVAAGIGCLLGGSLGAFCVGARQSLARRGLDGDDEAPVDPYPDLVPAGRSARERTPA
jgi:hypothetical protein